MPLPFPVTTYAFNETCGVMPLAPYARRPDVVSVSDAPTWRPYSGSGFAGPINYVNLGVDGPGWCYSLRDEAEHGSLLLLRSDDLHEVRKEARRRGYAVLDLRPLAGLRATVKWPNTYHSETAVGGSPAHDAPAEASLLVGQALAGAWGRHRRVAVVGPAWALDVLVALPGVVDFAPAPRPARGLPGTCVSHGRRWAVSEWPSPFEVAQRLSGPTPHAQRGEEETIASLRVGRRDALKRVCAVAKRGDDSLWRVDAGDLGQLVVRRELGEWYGEPVARWPSAEDPWLVDLVGDGANENENKEST